MLFLSTTTLLIYPFLGVNYSLILAIAKVITNATGWEYDCTFKVIEYVNTGTAEGKLMLETTVWLMPKQDWVRLITDFGYRYYLTRSSSRGS